MLNYSLLLVYYTNSIDANKKKNQCCLDVLFAMKQIFFPAFIVSLLPVDRNLSPV